MKIGKGGHVDNRGPVVIYGYIVVLIVFALQILHCDY